MNQKWVIKLTQNELRQAYELAGHRYFDSRMVGRNSEQYGYKGTMAHKLTVEHRGVIGEIAVAKALNMYHSAISFVGAPDVGFGFEVKAVEDMSRRLIVFKDERNACLFSILTRVLDEKPDEVVLAGWVYQDEAKVPENYMGYRAGGENYFVHNSRLRPMDEIYDVIKIKCVDDRTVPSARDSGIIMIGSGDKNAAQSGQTTAR